MPSLRNQDLKTLKEETEKINVSLNIPTINITKLNGLVYAGAKLVCGKSKFPRRTRRKNTKPDGKLDWKQGKKAKTTSTNGNKAEKHEIMFGRVEKKQGDYNKIYNPKR